jgi:hypothetical protein
MKASLKVCANLQKLLNKEKLPKRLWKSSTRPRESSVERSRATKRKSIEAQLAEARLTAQ